MQQRWCDGISKVNKCDEVIGKVVRSLLEKKVETKSKIIGNTVMNAE